MADIAFLLLIFFLVTTTMDVDTGLMRMLPPMPEKNPAQVKAGGLFHRPPPACKVMLFTDRHHP
jgi:biopolymer transport protein ExbD